jgi:hypothetical protein
VLFSAERIVEEMAMRIAAVLTLFYAACCQVPSLYVIFTTVILADWEVAIWFF